MTFRDRRALGLISILALAPLTALAQPTQYPNGKGDMIGFPQGPSSFADEVVDFRADDPDAGAASADPGKAFAPPDYTLRQIRAF
jgi:hypothetical protein